MSYDAKNGLRIRVAGLFAGLVVANILAWIWALIAFRHYPVFLGTAFLAYSLGLRHAVDADHIAAIDNVTRKLIAEGKRPTTVGFFFSLGHSTIVLLASVGVAVAATTFNARFSAFRDFGNIIGTLISSLFLLGIAIVNVVILVNVYRVFNSVKAGGSYTEESLDRLLAGRGLLTRLFRPLFALIRKSWQMYIIGFLFGLGFDTATEVSLLGISATQAAQGMPIWSILVFPALFTAGMSLIDTADSILMLSVYAWAFVKPVRKLYYNMAVTSVSVVIALVVCAIEVAGLLSDQLSLEGSFWRIIGVLNDNFGTIGYLIITIFVLIWIASVFVYRARNYANLQTDE
ncbi:MAG: HoxN/HupN/NixA family nickel/cobalt transporter [Acidobacteriia bacterium]|nr:HoxN/HupN/NixA family nickel/cobalt transporter [Methyloceanibacter sp.]MBX5471625.1 HoxN/HupN/NixA family nickel/cobalt transporter [Acetobacteraceae bacterium]MCL6490744.1 HoxN/HupN/NixA family nickel/cobalt transporter [Terriglobia bacterium]